MGRVENTVFMSYRRKDMPWALAVYENLTDHDYDVFFDYENIASGDFEQIILGNIRARAHFIILLTPSALDRCDKPDDWLRREIETALDEKRNIIPIFLQGFSFASPDVKKYLTGRLADLKKYNGLGVPDGYFKEAMQRLRKKFLAVPLDTVLHPVSASVQELVAKQQTAATNAVATQEKAPSNVSIGQARLKIIISPGDDSTILGKQLAFNRLHMVTLDGKQIQFNELYVASAKWQVEAFNGLVDAGQHEIILGPYSPTVESVSQKFSVSNGQTVTATIFPVQMNEAAIPRSIFKRIRWKVSIRVEQ